ncbi:hypothetical protein [Budvicia diplopodorum]|uniref:hypothetical protein n=1 Tax=Budvicia diplopodorum TaxID=1119056 RepID=UPI003CCE1F21
MLTPSGSTTREISISDGGNNLILTGGYPMPATPTQTHFSQDSLLTLAFDASDDFTQLAGYCERLVENLVECHSLPERLALCSRLTAMLTLLQPALAKPIPRRLIESLTVDDIPETSPCFEPETELLCDYCLTLAQLLSGRTFVPEMEQTLNGLLFELVCYFADELRMPRFVRTVAGVKLIDEVRRMM